MVLQLEENILCVLLCVRYFPLIKQNVYIPTENLDQLSNLIIGFFSVLVLLIDIYSS